MKKKHLALWLLSCACIVALLPETACAAGGITEFSGPLEKVVNTITGPVGRWIGIIGMALVGFSYIFQRSEMSESVKGLCAVVFGISFIAFAVSIVNGVFSFSGALVA